MPIQIKDSLTGYIADVNTNNALLVDTGVPHYGMSGGCFTVAGQTSGVIAASLAANTTLMSMRLLSNSNRQAYITRFRVLLGCGTIGIGGLVPGVIGLQRFSGATPTGGTARTPSRMGEYSLGSPSEMTDIRDSNAALTVTSVSFGTLVSNCIVPIFHTIGPSAAEWIYEPSSPIILQPGEGLCLRTQVAMPATQTTMLSYTIHWREK